MTDGPATVAVVGAGMTGLAATHRLVTRGANVVLLEAAPRLGGMVLTERRGGYLLEAGPDGFVAPKRSLLDLIDELGISGELTRPRADTAGISVWWEGELHPLPEGMTLMVPGRIGPALSSSLLSWKGKLRMLADLALPRRSGGEESLEAFVTRRMGREVLERIAEPLVAGIHVAPAESLSLQASFPRLLEIEHQHRSLLLTGRPSAEDEGPTHLAALDGGMGRLIEVLEEACRFAQVRTSVRAKVIEKTSDGLVLEIGDRDSIRVRSIILAVPAPQAARLLAPLAPEAAHALTGVELAPIASVHLGYRRDDVPDLPGHGFVVPAAAGRRIEGLSIVSRKWHGRAPADRVLWRVFVGGAHNGDIVRSGERAVREAVRAELADMLRCRAEPELERVHLWREGIHSYRLGHLERVAAVEEALSAQAGVFVAGSALYGIGLNECVTSGRRAADAALRATDPTK